MALTSDQMTLVRQYLADKGTSAVQSIQIENATGGSFTLTYSGQTTAAIPYASGANVVQNALCALSNVGVGNINVLNSSPYRVYFVGTLAYAAQPMLTADTSGLTGTGATADIVQVVAGGVTAFTDAELNAQFLQADGNLFLTVAYCYVVLAGGGAKFNDYTAGQTQEKKSQIEKHLQDMVDLWMKLAFSKEQVQFASLVSEPPRLRAVPLTQGQPAASLIYGPPYGRDYLSRIRRRP